MINLLDRNIDGINKINKDNILEIHINNSFDETLVADWTNTKENIVLVLEENVEIKLLELNACSAKCEYVLKASSSLKHNLLSLSSGGKSYRSIVVEKGASWEATSAELSLENVHFELFCKLMDENSKGVFKLSTLAKDSCNKLFDINFIHEFARTSSIMENYGVVQNEASLSFVGIGHIKKDSKKTEAHQSAKIMIFDKKCQAAASPILKIDENDTIASHSAALGKINDEHLFYLMSRGIEENEAKKIITLGYLNPVLPHIFDEESKKSVEKCILERI